MKRYYVYILTNINKTVLYTGVTNNLDRRLIEHKNDALGLKRTFAGKYNCIYLVYFEEYQFARIAISREKEIKSLNRAKKEVLINTLNPEWNFLNS